MTAWRRAVLTFIGAAVLEVFIAVALIDTARATGWTWVALHPKVRVVNAILPHRCGQHWTWRQHGNETDPCGATR